MERGIAEHNPVPAAASTGAACCFPATNGDESPCPAHKNVGFRQIFVANEQNSRRSMLSFAAVAATSRQNQGNFMPLGPKPKRTAISAAVAAALVASPLAAQQTTTDGQRGKNRTRALEEITVTATRVEESLQSVPIAVHALGGDDIAELGITNFSDYVLQLPSVTAGGSGPGQNTIYIRGIASTTPNLTTAGVAGLAPNVAFYLDDQPLAQPGRNLDVYAADLQRIEVLSGPQGTLFGASSQAGNVRLITNKPDLSGTFGSISVGAGAVAEGEGNSNIEAMLNVPLGMNFGVRGVVYYDRKGGWIDNVAGTIDASESARFRPEGTVRANGVPVSAQRAGFQSSAATCAANGFSPTCFDLSGVTFLEADNSDLVEEDINETTYTGGRIAARWDVNDDWRIDLAYATQDLDSDGVFFADPDLGDLEIQRYAPDRIEDSFDNISWTVTALFGELEAIYTGAYTDRETDQLTDYTDYMFVGQYLPYYICDSSVTYVYTGVPGGACQPTDLFVNSHTETEVQTHEFRLTTDQARRWRVTAGVFFSDLELRERNDFTYPGSEDAFVFGSPGFSPNFPFMTGYLSDPGPFPEGVIFRNDVKRTDEQLGVFGEFSYDLNDQWSVTVGGRWYDIDVDFDGGANASFCNSFQDDADAFGTDIADLYNGDGQYTFRGTCSTDRHVTYTADQSAEDIAATDPELSPDQVSQIFNAVRAPSAAVADGTIFKATLDWRPIPGQMYYLTWSEGFRPGLLNRPGGAAGPNNFTVPFELDTDDVTNIEIGTKADFFDSTFRLNAALFFVDIERLQTTIFDPSITNLFFSDNAADAEVTGFEGDFSWLPAFSDRWTFSGSFSILDTEITRVITPTNDVRAGDELAFAPEFQGSLRARYEWDLRSGWAAHIMPMVTWSSESFSDIVLINRDRIDSWTMWGLTAGIANEKWSFQLFGNNLSDERAEVARNFVFNRQRVTYAAPRTIGVRASLNF
jgi:iron complex outermembrane receptor protein